MSKTFYITTTLPYVNADPHIGFAMEIIRADVIARAKVLEGYDVFFNTGTDEHGQKLLTAAKAEGKDIQKYVDEYAERFRGLKSLLGISDDVHFIRTTDPHHITSAQEFWNRCNERGYIYKKNYQTKYCVGCELEKTDSELNEKGECPIHPGHPLELIDEENYFFKFSAFQQPLLDYYEKNPNFVLPEFRFHEIKSFVKNGLEDFSISRLKSKMSWGVPVPGDDDHVMYVWFDALVNYISTLGWPESENQNAENFQKYWVDGTPTQYCGKDNLRQQSAMWQAMLMAADLPCSHQIVINGFITGDGGIKMSKSLGNVYSPYDIVKEYGTEALRYFLLREISPFEDSPFTMERFKEAYNSGLANGLGNLVSRLMKMATANNITVDKFPTYEEALEGDAGDPVRFSVAISDFNIKQALDLLWTRIQIIDGIIQMEQPFKSLKSDNPGDKLRGAKCVEEALIELYRIALLLESILPFTSIEIQRLIQENRMPVKPLFLRKD